MTEPTPVATATPTARTRALSRCIEPVEVEEFLAGYWEQKPLVVRRREPGRFDDLLSREGAERLLSSTALRFPAFRLVRAGDQIDPRSYTKDLGWSPEPFTGTIDVASTDDRMSALRDIASRLQTRGVQLSLLGPAEARAEEPELGHSVSREGLLAAILNDLGNAYERADREGVDWILPGWRSRTSMLGKPVTFRRNGMLLRGLAEDIGLDGALLVRTSDGTRVSVVAGDVELVRLE